MADDTKLTLTERVAQESTSGTLDLVRAPALAAIPSPSADLAALTKSVAAIKTLLDSRTGRGGSAYDQWVSLRDLVDGGAVQLNITGLYSNSGYLNGSGGTSTGGGGGGGTIIDDTDPRPWLDTPPTPTDFGAQGVFKNIILTWTMTPYRNSAYIEVWRNTVNNRTTAVVVGQTPSDQYNDPNVVYGITYYYWVRAVGFDQTTNAPIYSDYNAIDGVVAALGLVGSSDLGNAVVLSQNLAPGSVTADKAMLDIGGDNLLNNNSFEVDTDGDGLADGWGGYNNSYPSELIAFSRTTGRISGYAQRLSFAGNSTSKGLYYPGPLRGASFLPNKTYVVSWYARASAAQTFGMNMGWNTAPTAYVALRNPNLATTWQRYAFRITFGASTESVLFLTIAYGSNMSGWYEVDDVQVEEGDTLSGYQGKLAANTIVAGDAAIANAAITNALIANLAVDSAKIANGAITTAKIGDAQITTAKIGDAQIIDAKIATLDAGKINTGTLNAGRIAAGSITADKIDSRGLSIKDGSGNVILAAGSPLSYTYVIPSQQWQNNLMDASWWSTSLSPWAYGWPLNNDGSEGNVFYQRQGPSGNTETIWEAVGDGSGPGGGWNPGGTGNTITVDKSKTYRFVIPMMRYSGSGEAWWGITWNQVCTLNTTTPNPNPYFVPAYSFPQLGRWFLFVGYVFPYGSTSNDNNGAGVYDMVTGAKVANGYNYNWASTAATIGTRAYQYSAPVGAVQWFAKPQVHLVDGSEPTLDSILAVGSPSARNPITASNASTYIANAAIGSAQIGTLTAGNLTVTAISNTINGGATGSRVEIQTNRILVYDGAVIRVKLGDLS